MKVLILLGVIAVAFATKQCGKNQHYNSCGTACPTTCDNKDDEPRPCILMCKSGCHCDAGYVRNADNDCVRPEECPAKSEPVCGENQRFNECGTSCPLTCENYRNPPKICNFMCNIGCECEEGYVKSRDGRCVKPFNCPVNNEPVCGENERYNECGTDCPLKCDNYLNPPIFCNKMCKIGCECEEGYVRAPDHRCVRPFNCPQNATTLKSCLGAPETGMCKAYIPRYHYDIHSGVCKQFIYGGCGGNGNNYETEEECMNHCEGVAVKNSNAVCELEKVVGPCQAAFRRYFYNTATGECEQFIYGGCRGNANNFRTRDECHEICKA